MSFFSSSSSSESENEDDDIVALTSADESDSEATSKSFGDVYSQRRHDENRGGAVNLANLPEQIENGELDEMNEF